VDWQFPLALLLVATAAGYLARRGWRSWRASRKGCGGSCGCHKTPTTGEAATGKVLIPVDQLTVRRHRPPQAAG
jgi:hypothetical protein